MASTNKLPWSALMIPMSFCCQHLRCCGPMPEMFGLSLCPSSSGHSCPQCILCTDVTHCICFHYNRWHSNKAISSLNTVFIRPLQEKHSVKCTHKTRCQCCKFPGECNSGSHSMKMQEKMTPGNTHDGQSAHNQVMIMKLDRNCHSLWISHKSHSFYLLLQFKLVFSTEAHKREMP